MRGLSGQLVLVMRDEEGVEFVVVEEDACPPFQGVITRASFQALTNEFSDP